MGNMSYCRFENTAEDLRDCLDNFDDYLSKREAKYREKIYKMCQKIVNNYDIDELNECNIEEE